MNMDVFKPVLFNHVQLAGDLPHSALCV